MLDLKNLDLYIYHEVRKSSIHKTLEKNPPKKSNLYICWFIPNDNDRYKQIAADALHNKIPIFEIMPTLGYPHVCAESLN